MWKWLKYGAASVRLCQGYANISAKPIPAITIVVCRHSKRNKRWLVKTYAVSVDRLFRKE
jgi:hypothetical protein